MSAGNPGRIKAAVYTDAVGSYFHALETALVSTRARVDDDVTRRTRESSRDRTRGSFGPLALSLSLSLYVVTSSWHIWSRSVKSWKAFFTHETFLLAPVRQELSFSRLLRT